MVELQPSIRVRVVVDRPPAPGRRYVLSWMIGARRHTWNFALDRAVDWARALRLPVFALVAWALFALAVPRLYQSLNAVDVMAFPLGFFMAAQGCLLALLGIAILSARRRDRIEASMPNEETSGSR